MARRQPTPVNVRNFSVKCGRCGQYQVLATFEAGEEWNTYTYECDWPPCDDDVAGSRTLLEIPTDLDEFANRDPNWGGGKKHAGADMRSEDSEDEDSGDPDDSEPGDQGLVTIGS